jgi:multimeric flavodoxin WrbA
MDKAAKTPQQLEAEGWKIASVTGGAHLKRTLEMYRELGIEVYLEKVKPEECEGCTKCFTENNEAIYRIYTRLYST